MYMMRSLFFISVYLLELVGAIIAVFLMAIFYEGLKTLRELLLYWDLSRFKPKTSRCSAAEAVQTTGYKQVTAASDDQEEQPISSK